MRVDDVFESERLIYRCIDPDDVTQEYVDWLNEPEVNQFLESRFISHDLESTRKYVDSVNINKNGLLFGIFIKKNRKHIGNVGLTIDPNHKKASLGLLIGDKESWGKGVACEIFKAVVRYAFNHLDLFKVYCGVYVSNIGSIKALKRAGFKEEGRCRLHCICNGKREDSLYLGILKTDLKEQHGKNKK